MIPAIRKLTFEVLMAAIVLAWLIGCAAACGWGQPSRNYPEVSAAVIDYVFSRGRLVPRILIESDGRQGPGVCVRCDGLGDVPEPVKDGLHDEMVPCFMCQTFCKGCGKWVKKPHIHGGAA